MARSILRGKALLEALRARGDVRDADALAAYLGRVRKHRRAGKSLAEAKGLARGPDKVSSDSKADTKAESDRGPDKADIDRIGDPFNEDFGDPETAESDDEREQREYEAKLLADLEKSERSDLHTAILDAGGIKTRADLREEYREIPNTFKRKDGLAGDEMADYLKTYFPEFGIEDENDLLDFFLRRD